MSNLLTDTEVKNLAVSFLNFDERYIEVENDGMIERMYLRPLMNEFYANFMADPTDYPLILDDVRKAVAYLVMDKVVSNMGKSKTKNLGELQAFTQNTKTVESTSNKENEYYIKGIQLLIEVGCELLNNSEVYNGFNPRKIHLDFSFRNSHVIV